MDHLSNLLTAIRNAELAHHVSLVTVNTKLNRSVLAVLKAHGYVTGFAETEAGLEISLPQPTIRHHYRRISKPSRRLYTDAKSIPTIRQGLGMVIISTSAGVLAGPEARKKRLGGEVLCEVY